MKVKVVIDNISDSNLVSEWGLSLYIENNNKSYLLDTGASDKYLTNLKLMGIDVSSIDYAVLSHAHTDHSSGFISFFKNNDKAKLYMSENVSTDCYFKIGLFKAYVGIPKNLKEEYKDRIEYVSDIYELDKDVYIMSHNINVNNDSFLYQKYNNKYIKDVFKHEVNLIFDTTKGLVVLNSCSHIGANNIINEILEAFPNRKIYAYIGGLHLASQTKKYDRYLGESLKELDIPYIYTGHCTKNKGFKVLHNILGDKITQIKCGMEIEL